MTMPSDNVTQIHAKLVEMERESRIPAALRDSLLPKLVSGKLRVKDVELLVERAL